MMIRCLLHERVMKQCVVWIYVQVGFREPTVSFVIAKG